MNSQAYLEELVAKYIEGTCCPKELKALEARLLEDDVNRAYFLEIVMLAEDLGMLNDSRQRRIGFDLVPAEILLQRQRWREAKTALLAAAAVILFSAVAIWPQMAPKHESALAGFRVAPGEKLAMAPDHHKSGMWDEHRGSVAAIR